MCVGVLFPCMSGHHVHELPQRPEGGIGSPVTRIIDTIHLVEAGNLMPVSAGTATAEPSLHPILSFIFKNGSNYILLIHLYPYLAPVDVGFLQHLLLEKQGREQMCQCCVISSWCLCIQTIFFCMYAYVSFSSD